MINRRTIIFSLVITTLATLGFPTLAAAQGYDPWYRNRDRRYDYYGRDLRDSVRRVDRLSGQLKGDLDHALDRTRLDGSYREDQINRLAHDFHEAASKFKDRFDDGRDLNRAAGEARRTLELGAQLDRFISRHNLGGRVESKWAQISSDLRVIARAYGFGYYSSGDRYGRGPWGWPR
jgi:hypothetical protein